MAGPATWGDNPRCPSRSRPRGGPGRCGRGRQAATKCPARRPRASGCLLREEETPWLLARPRPPPAGSLLHALGIYGWEGLEPAVLAALATESPLLLIGGHGTAKTLLLGRLAAALGLQHRHYNASLLSFDDLVGFPVPQDGRLVWLQTPATIWEAESALFDEVSRCRPELQNKLFPIVHERVVQGLPLPRLRHRWAAMNPPPRPDAGDDGTTYVGAEPLDVALADRFAFVLESPGFEDLSPADQRRLLERGPEESPGAREALRDAVAALTAALPEAAERLRGRAADYVRAIAASLRRAGHPLSTRRAAQLARNVVAVRGPPGAGHRPPGGGRLLRRAARLAPDAAWGRPVEASALLTAHRTAWEALRLDPDGPLARIQGEADPLRRIALALRAHAGGELEPGAAGAVAADSYAALPAAERLAAAAALLPRLSRAGGLPTTALEPVARDFARVAAGGAASLPVSCSSGDWRRQVVPGAARARRPPSAAAGSTTWRWRCSRSTRPSSCRAWRRSTTAWRPPWRRAGPRRDGPAPQHERAAAQPGARGAPGAGGGARARARGPAAARPGEPGREAPGLPRRRGGAGPARGRAGAATRPSCSARPGSWPPTRPRLPACGSASTRPWPRPACPTAWAWCCPRPRARRVPRSPLDLAASLAVLSRVSGALYSPRRAGEASLLRLSPVVVLFPEEA